MYKGVLILTAFGQKQETLTSRTERPFMYRGVLILTTYWYTTDYYMRVRTLTTTSVLAFVRGAIKGADPYSLYYRLLTLLQACLRPQVCSLFFLFSWVFFY